MVMGTQNFPSITRDPGETMVAVVRNRTRLDVEGKPVGELIGDIKKRKDIVPGETEVWEV